MHTSLNKTTDAVLYQHFMAVDLHVTSRFDKVGVRSLDRKRCGKDSLKRESINNVNNMTFTSKNKTLSKVP